MEQRVLDQQLFHAVQLHDLDAVKTLIQQGADPFVNIAAVDLYMIRQSLSVKLASGCAAAQAIQWPHILEALLPEKMQGWPAVTRAIDVYGISCRKGEMVDLGQWAIELSALQSLRLLIDRLDRSHSSSEQSLNRLTMSCLAGCSHEQAEDDALGALTICMAAQPELGRGWSHWRHAKLVSQSANHEPIYMPMTFVMGSCLKKASLKDGAIEEALRAFSWALAHDDCVRSGDRRMGSTTEDTILHLGVSSGCIPFIQACLEQHCVLDVQDAQGLTPLELGRLCNKNDAVDFIESWKSNLAWNEILNSVPMHRAASAHMEKTS